jgi:hypothetical protein
VEDADRSICMRTWLGGSYSCSCRSGLSLRSLVTGMVVCLREGSGWSRSAVLSGNTTWSTGS